MGRREAETEGRETEGGGDAERITHREKREIDRELQREGERGKEWRERERGREGKREGERESERMRGGRRKERETGSGEDSSSNMW